VTVDAQNIGLALPPKLWQRQCLDLRKRWNISSLTDRDAAIWTCSSTSCTVSNVEAHTIFLDIPKRKIRGFRSGERLGHDTGPLPSYPSPSVGSLKSNFWRHSWTRRRQHRACTTHFVLYSAVRYPITLTECAPKSTSSRINCELLSSWLYYVDLRRSKCACYGNFVQLHVKPTSWVKSTRLLRKVSSPHCRRNNWPNSWHGRKLSGLEVVPVVNGTVTAAVHGEPVTLLCAPHFRKLVFNERRYRHYPSLVSPTVTRSAVLALLPAIYRSRGNSTGL
jgi:hypothetical protein